MSNDLAAFLQARLDEDEQIARTASRNASAAWHLDEEFGETVLWWPPEFHTPYERDRHWRGQDIEFSGQAIAPHIARHDPARVLAEVKAKQYILTMCADIATRGAEPERQAQAELTLRALAFPYRSHPDCHPDWVPDL
ncbi:DUF6221 family protein [Kitasatospora sp. NPDC004289]